MKKTVIESNNGVKNNNSKKVKYNHLKTLVAMQLRDKVDLSWVKDKKKALRRVLFILIKFAIIAAATFVLLYLGNRVSLFTYNRATTIVVIVLTISLLLSLITCTFELMKTLYFAEDNKVLITLPVNTNVLFISKIIVYYIYELKKSLSFLVPIAVGCTALLVWQHTCSPLIYLWMWLPLLFIIALPVLFGAILSIPAMYINRALRRVPVLKIVLFLITLAAVITGVIYLINLLPDSINLIAIYHKISGSIEQFLITTEAKLAVFRQLTYILIGEKVNLIEYKIQLYTFIKFGILVSICCVAFALVYFISRPIFFGMMAKNFEINKNNVDSKPNKHRTKYGTFVNKEFIINLRTINISVNYLMTYIIIPILVLFINKIYTAMNLSMKGHRLVNTFNILIIVLPLLASNALVATYYSSEGRAGYMKKTKPVFIVYPLLIKLLFNILFSIPTVFVTVGIFGGLNQLGVINILLLGFAILFIHVGHMIYSATLDIMNPQNEQYATTGETIDNPNETKSTILAFVITIIIALISYKLFVENSIYNSKYTASIKLLIISILFLGTMLYMFFQRVKAYYYEIQGDRQ